MSWSLNIGTIASTAVRVHVTFLLFLGWIFAASWIVGGPESAWQGLAFLVLLFACVLAHEFGHIFTARAFGVSTPDVTLLPIGGVARLERIPEEPYEEFLIAIAGPLVNVAIAIALILIVGANVSMGDLYAVESPTASMVDRLAAVNLFLAVFNMIPAFPMDGGRVLQPDRFSRGRRGRQAGRRPRPQRSHSRAQPARPDGPRRRRDDDRRACHRPTPLPR
jgi:Zn-dependent protease